MAGTTSASGEKCLDGLVAFIEWRGPDLMSGGLVSLTCRNDWSIVGLHWSNPGASRLSPLETCRTYKAAAHPSRVRVCHSPLTAPGGARELEAPVTGEWL